MAKSFNANKKIALKSCYVGCRVPNLMLSYSVPFERITIFQDEIFAQYFLNTSFPLIYFSFNSESGGLRQEGSFTSSCMT